MINLKSTHSCMIFLINFLCAQLFHAGIAHAQIRFPGPGCYGKGLNNLVKNDSDKVKDRNNSSVFDRLVQPLTQLNFKAATTRTNESAQRQIIGQKSNRPVAYRELTVLPPTINELVKKAVKDEFGRLKVRVLAA